MSKFKKVLSMALVVTLTAGIAISGTMAYLTSQDSDVNVMTLGNVEIKQHEYQRATDEGGEYETASIDGRTSYVLEAFEQAKPLYPIVGDPSKPGDDPGYAGYDSTPVRMSQVDSHGGMDVFAGKNAQDKFVTVENTGKTDAYVRTIVAIEVGSTDGSLIGSSYHMTWGINKVTDVENSIVNINGNNYYVIEYVYAGAKLSDGTWRHEGGVLPAGDTSYPNLSQVYLKSEATNEDMEAIDGNKNGTLDILVLSQAIQAAGFSDAQTALDTGFGDVNAANVQEWFGSTSVPTTVSSVAELTGALAAGEDVVVAKDIDEIPVETIAPYGNYYGIKVAGNVVDGGGNALSFDKGLMKNSKYDNYGIMTSGGTIKNVTVDGVFRGIMIMSATEDVILDNVHVGGTEIGYALNTGEHATVEGVDLIVTNSSFDGWSSFAGIASASFTDCTFGVGSYFNSWPYDSLIKPYVTTTFTNCEFAKNYYLDLSSLGAGCTVTLTGCTVNSQTLTADIVGTSCNGTEAFCVELPSWATSLNDCVTFN